LFIHSAHFFHENASFTLSFIDNNITPDLGAKFLVLTMDKSIVLAIFTGLSWSNESYFNINKIARFNYCFNSLLKVAKDLAICILKLNIFWPCCLTIVSKCPSFSKIAASINCKLFSKAFFNKLCLVVYFGIFW
jgi:hypothetical protein